MVVEVRREIFNVPPPVPHHLSSHHKAFTKTEMHFISNYFLVFFTYSLPVLLLHPVPFCPGLLRELLQIFPCALQCFHGSQ